MSTFHIRRGSHTAIDLLCDSAVSPNPGRADEGCHAQYAKGTFFLSNQTVTVYLVSYQRLARLADPRVSQLFANAIRGCETVLDVPPLMHNPDDSVLSALEIVLHEDEVYGARGRVYGGDLLGIRIAIRLLPVGFPNRVSRFCHIENNVG
jgi:hypothetical protein